MNGKFKVWDSELKYFDENNDFFVNSNGELMIEVDSYGSQNETHLEPADKKFKIVCSTGEIDKYGVELFDGDIYNLFINNKLVSGNNIVDDYFKSKNYHMIQNGEVPVYEKIGSKYEV
jgi:hypothetical protein